MISKELHDASVWDEKAIRGCADRLAARALEVWQRPELSADVVASYKPAKKIPSATRAMTFRTVCNAAHLIPGTVLVAVEAGRRIMAEVTDEYRIRLDGENIFRSPSRAATRVKELVMGKYSATNGWKYWCVGESGPLLLEVRARCLSEVENPDLKSLFWDGFYEYCGDRQDFVDAYADPSNRAENNGWVATFGLGLRGVHATALFAQRDGWVGVDL